MAAFTAGQASDWPDTDILRANDLPVATTATYSSLFQMLGKQRFDYMPRSVVEVWQEAESHRGEGLIVDQHTLPCTTRLRCTSSSTRTTRPG